MVDIPTDDARGGRETRNHKITKMLIASIVLAIVSLLLVFYVTG